MNAPRLHCPKHPDCWVTFADDEHLEAEVVQHMSRAHDVSTPAGQVDELTALMVEVTR